MSLKYNSKDITSIPNIQKVMNGKDLVWIYKHSEELIEFSFLDNIGSKNYYKIRVKQGETYNIYLDKETYMDAGYSPNDVSVMIGSKILKTHTVTSPRETDIILTVWGAKVVKVTQIQSGGGSKPLNINVHSYLSEVAI